MREYNLPNHISGDTFLGVSFALANQNGPINLTNAVITLTTNRGITISTTTGELVITNAAGGIFEIKEQIISFPKANYEYTIGVAFASGRKRTYIRGNWQII